MDRRSVVRVVGTAGFAFIAGCLSESDDTDTSPSLASVTLANHTGDPVELRVRAYAADSVTYDQRHELEAATIEETDNGEEYLSTGRTVFAEEWMAVPELSRCEFAVPTHELSASFDADEAAIGEGLVSNAEPGPCYYLAVHVGGEEYPLTTNPATVPERLTVVSDWYDTGIFDREHVGDCS